MIHYFSRLQTCLTFFLVLLVAQGAFAQRVVSTKTESYNENDYSSATKTTTVTADDFGVETTTIEIRDRNNTLREKHDIKKTIDGDKVETTATTTRYDDRGRLHSTVEERFDQNGKPILGTSYNYDADGNKTGGTRWELRSDGRYNISRYNTRKDEWRQINTLDESFVRASNQHRLNLFGPHLGPQQQTAPAPPAPQETPPISGNLFQRGNWELGLTRNIDFSFLKEVQNGQETGTEKNVGANLSTTYFVANNFGIGANIRYDWAKSTNGIEITTSDMTAYLSATYGYGFGPRFGIYGQVGFGLGKSKALAESGTNSFEETGNIVGYSLEVGAPILLDGNVYLGPQISYYGKSTDYGKLGEFDEGGLRFSLNLRSYLNCKDEPESMRDMDASHFYQPGRSFIGVSTRSMVSVGNYKWMQDNVVDDVDFCEWSFKADYNYYVFPYVALGAEVRLSSSTEQNQDQDQSDRQFQYAVMPQFTLNAPIDGLQHLFLTGGVGFGRIKTTNEIGSDRNEQKDKLFTIGGGLGYNFYVTDLLALTPIIRYDSHSREDDQTDQKIRSRGVSGEFGVRFTF
jgi:opacity protein-like surface antigen